MSLPRVLKNFILFNDGNVYLGEVPEATPPKLSRKMEDYRSGGMNGPIGIDLGMEAMEFDWTAAGYMRSLFTQWGTPTHDGVLLRLTGAIQADDVAGTQAVELVMRGRHKEIDFGNAKAGEKTEIKIKSSLSYYKLVIDGEVIMEIDFVNLIEIVGGVDRMAQIRQALGLF
ncbi:phage tail protein [Variovorax paradoxus]|uniref:Phage tail protein n=1 Tax=Variovorax paradoxus TaxID=34073 RepID=A0AA91DH46_VARPD|nr:MULTISPECIES: phage major tail tube protein [Variovorax]OAK55043.1 phage tail protein [Variovorax paradoxus]QRY30560.1 phage major tail tube protein [Variovorax sp. PDNC026]